MSRGIITLIFLGLLMNEQFLWHSIEFEEVVKNLKSNSTHGLSHDEAKNRIQLYGTNTLPRPKPRSYLTIFLHQFLSPLIYLLLSAAGIAIFISDVKDSIVILVVVILNAIIGTFQEGRAEHSLNELKRLAKLNSRVLREGRELIIEAGQIVPGDILILNTGDAVAADARLIKTVATATSEASLTGESLPISKINTPLPETTPLPERYNMVYAGTYISSGNAQAIVVATGVKNEIGKIASLTNSIIEPKTQLEQRIQLLGKSIALASLLIFILVIGVGLFKKILFSEILMIAISQMVSIVPEGLPVAMTIALAVGVQRMARKGTIVRRLAAVEILGSITVICADKTGTLTKNEMMVTSVYLPNEKKEIAISGTGYAPDCQIEEEDLNRIFEACILCNNAQLLAPDNSSKEWRISGDPTEGALLTFAAKGGMDSTKIKKAFPRIAELPFDSHNKMMATQHEINGETIVFIKGAPEEIVELCAPMDLSIMEGVQKAEKKMACESLRILALGYVEGIPIDPKTGYQVFNKKLTLLGLVGELDPPRVEVAGAVIDCKNAGIRPIMITGDHKVTGEVIAKSLSISTKNDMVIDGVELDKLTDNELSERLDTISVFARVMPSQKLRIVEALQKKGEIVAMTGDGVNDAPALMQANVGVAMGITGTEVAKEAAKIIITDDNFATIITAIEEGRLVYQNIRKLILFLFVTSIDELLILFLALTLGFPPPLAAVQILWINLVTEGVLTINLIMEPSEGHEMKIPPTPAKQPLLDKKLLSRIPLLVLAAVIATIGWFLYRTNSGVSTELVQSETFTMLVICQWFNVLNCRSSVKSVFSWSLFKNIWLLNGLILGIILQLSVIYWAPLGRFFHTVPIDIGHLFTIGAVASLVLWVEEIRKFIIRKFKI